MTLKINHSFISTRPVGTDTSRIYSDSWNANHTITGQADGSQLNPNVVQAVVSDINVTGSITSQTLTLAWSGTLAASRLNANVVQAVTNDTNITGTISAQNITLGWTGILGLSRGGTAADLSATGGAKQYLKQTGAGAPVTVGTIPASDIASGQPLSAFSDTNITLSLGGSYPSSVLASTTITVGWSGTLAANRGGFGADISAQSGVPLFATGVATFTGTTGSGNFVRATSPTISTSATIAAGADNTTFATITGAGGNGRFLASTDAGGNVHLRSQNSLNLSLGVNTSDVFTVSATGATLSQALTYGGVTLNNAVTGTGNLVLSSAPTITLTNATGLPLSGHTSQAAYTIVGNFTGSSAAPTASTIGALTQKASPAASDLIMLQDQAASGALKYATVSSIASAGSVSSIGSLTGAFTIDGGNLSSNVLPFPRNDTAQSWTTAQQKQVRQNIGADNGVILVDRNGTNQTGLTAGAANKISFNNKVKDANGWFDAVTNFRYTPLIAGTYIVALNVLSNNGTSGETCQALIYKNGASVKTAPYFAATSAASYQSQIVAAIPMNGSTDYLEFYIYLPATITTLNGMATVTNVQAYRIGD